MRWLKPRPVVSRGGNHESRWWHFYRTISWCFAKLWEVAIGAGVTVESWASMAKWTCLQRSSSWYHLKISFACILRYRNNVLMTKTLQEKPSAITIQEMENAEKVILKNVRQEAFPGEFNELSKSSGNKHVKRSSCLFKLDPILEYGLLRVGGRLARACISCDAKHQIILPKKNHVSSLHWPFSQAFRSFRRTACVEHDTPEILDYQRKFYGEKCPNELL